MLASRRAIESIGAAAWRLLFFSTGNMKVFSLLNTISCGLYGDSSMTGDRYNATGSIQGGATEGDSRTAMGQAFELILRMIKDRFMTIVSVSQDSFPVSKAMEIIPKFLTLVSR